MNVLGVDFGTSNTVAVLVGDGRPPRVLAIDGVGALPSCVYIDDDGSLTVGRDAERRARLAPERFEANPKRRIDDGEILLGVRVVPVVEAIAAVLRRVIDEARRQLNGRSPDHINLTHPAGWGAARQNILLAAARTAGLGPSLSLVPEPVAAAAHFSSLPGRSMTPGASLAVYDLGGGTFDCAVVGSTPNGFTVLAESGLADVGGVDFDQAVVDHLGRTVSSHDPAKWQALSRPRNSTDRRAARTLREDVRAGKETLSRYAQADLPLPDPFDDTLLTRKEFEGLIRPVIARTVEVLASTIGRAGLTADRLGGIYLVGGSSRIPLVAAMIADRLGVVPVTLDQPETAVAMGAALIPVRAQPQSRTEFLGGAAAAGQIGPVSTGRPGRPGGYGPVGLQYDSGPPTPPVPGRGGAVGRPRRNRVLLIAAVVVAVLVAGTAAVVATRSSSAAGGPVDISSPPSSPGSTTRPPTTSRPTTTPTSASRKSVSSSSTGPSRTSGSRSTTSSSGPVDPTGCSTVGDARGISGCMQPALGSLGVLDCTADPAQLKLDTTTEAELKTLTTSFATCVDRAAGYATVIFQTTGVAGRDVLWPFLLGQFTPTRNGTWHTGKASGPYAVGLSSSGHPALAWKDSTRPVLAFIGAGNGISESDLVTYWSKALGATVTG